LVRKLFFLAVLLCLRHIAAAQDEALEKAGLLLDQCSFAPAADMMILRDAAEVSVNNDFSLRLDRKVTYKIFREQKIDRQLATAVFYLSPFFDKYYRLSLRTVELDPTTKALIPRDYSSKVTSAHIDQLNIKMKSGALLEVSYSTNFPYDQKIPDWHFQSQYPTDFSSIRILTPDVVQLRETIEGSYSPEVKRSSELSRPLRLANQTQTVKLTERYYQFNQLPAAMPEPFADHPRGQLARLHMHMASVTKGGDVRSGFIEAQMQGIIEFLSTRTDFLLRLVPPLDIKSEYDRRVRSISDPAEKIARIYDLVRRHITWDHVDSLAAGHTLAKVWNDKKGNSTEINLVLIKLLQMYGYDAAPLIVSTRTHGPIDTDEVALSDFNRTVAHVYTGSKSIVLDATGRFYDYPTVPAAILNTRGLLISMDPDRWIEIRDTASLYKNTVTLLGHLSGDTSFITYVYVNSYGYAKPEHVEILETDSLKGLRRYFERGNKKIQLKHFVAANEYMDTLPLAQEFDIRVPLVRNDNLSGVVTTWFCIPDTLFTITEDRRCDINFGYRQEYDLISEFTFPVNYEIYLLPNNVKLSAVNGSVQFEREYHPGNTDFSLRQTLKINKSYFTKAEAVELAKFLKKISNLNIQQVMLKKSYNK
jgi:hypothetical protein